jgi:hypothetical protein
MDLSRGDNGEMASQGRDVADWLNNLNQGIALNSENATAMAEASLQMAVATGQMSKLDAAQEKAALHTQEYTAAMEDLQKALANASALPEGFAKKSALTSLQNQGTAWSGERAVQSKQDQQDISDQQVGHVLGVGVNQMVTAWTDASQQVVGLFQNSVNSFNSTLVNVMTSRNRQHQIPREFEAMGHSMFTDATSRSLQAAEGTIGKMFGFGGAKVAHVHVDNWPGDIASAASGISGIAGKAAGLFGGLFGSKGSAPISKIPSGGGYDFGSNPLASLAMTALPMLAGGGDMPANSMAIVGERGPELLQTKAASRVVPNGKFGGDTHFHIDARGAADPAATEAAIHRAMGQYLPAAVGASVGAMKEQSRRVPLSHR